MADQNPVTISITASIQGLISGMQEATASVQENTALMSAAFGRFGSVMNGFRQNWLAMIGVIAGGAIFKEAISGTVEWETEALKLSRTLGVTTEQASIMKVAFASVGIQTETYVGAVQRMTRQLASGGEGFKKLGIEVHDSSGNLKSTTDLMSEVIEKLNGLKEGSDRNTAAAAVFGRGWQELQPILYLNSEAMKAAEEQARRLHLIVGPEGAEQARQYKIGLEEVKLVATSLEVQLGSQLLPVLTRFGSWFSKEGPTLADGLVASIQYITVGFLGLKAVVETITTTVAMTLNLIIDSVKGVGLALWKLAHGDVKGAVDEIQKGFTEGFKEMDAAFDNMAESWSKTMQKSGQILAPPKPKVSAEPKGGHFDPEDLKAEKEAHEARLAQLREEMEEQRRNGEARIALAKQIVDEEIKFNGAGSKEAIKAKQELVKVEREVADEHRALMQQQIQTDREFSLALLANQEKDLDRKRKEGQLSIAEELRASRQLEDEKYAIKKAATDKELALDGLTEKEREKLRRQELLDEATHQTAVADLQSKAMLQETEKVKGLLSPIRSGFNKLFDDILKGTISFSEIWNTIWQGIAKMGINALLDLGEKFVETKLAQIILGKAAGAAQIPAIAAVAGANAAAATAAIPIIGPELSLGAGTAEYASVLSAFGGLASAAGGWAIPNSINPIMQAHGGEHVIPKDIAKRYERGAPGAQRGNSNTFHIHSMDGKGVERTLRDMHRKGRFR